MNTTDQQAVTATRWLERAEHCNPVLPTPNSPMFAAVAEEMEEYAECKVAAFARLASVSSASAEPSVWAKQAPTHIWLHGIGDPIVETTWATDPSPSGDAEEEAHAVAYVRADIAASPEPVPATNQAGEVERLRAALQHIEFEAGRENGGWVHLKRSIAVHARAALATQPATPQEGEGRIGGGVVFYNRGGYSVRPAGSPFEGTADGYKFIPLTDEQVAALAATPTRPTLSEDLREALERIRDSGSYRTEGRAHEECVEIATDALAQESAS